MIGYQDPSVDGAELACAVVVPAKGQPTLAVLREFLDAEQVSRRDWPDRVEVVPELPRNAQGKVLRSALRQRLG
jgi:non-ribosomal peptide synthetase component E (peptide arylation enzyme)